MAFIAYYAASEIDAEQEVRDEKSRCYSKRKRLPREKGCQKDKEVDLGLG